jgi:hypothetical protein
MNPHTTLCQRFLRTTFIGKKCIYFYLLEIILHFSIMYQTKLISCHDIIIMCFSYSCFFRIEETLCCFQHGSIGFFHKGQFTRHLQKRVDFEHVHISINSNLLEKNICAHVVFIKCSIIEKTLSRSLYLHISSMHSL